MLEIHEHLQESLSSRSLRLLIVSLIGCHGTLFEMLRRLKGWARNDSKCPLWAKSGHGILPKGPIFIIWRGIFTQRGFVGLVDIFLIAPANRWAGGTERLESLLSG